MKIRDELLLNGMTCAAADEIEYNNIGEFKPATVTSLDIIFLDGKVIHIPDRKNIHVMHSILQL